MSKHRIGILGTEFIADVKLLPSVALFSRVTWCRPDGSDGTSQSKAED